MSFTVARPHSVSIPGRFGGHFPSRYGLRRWAKVTLARNFVYQIAAPNTLIAAGPYAFLVHPSYTGALLHVTGIVMLGTAALACAVTVTVTVTVIVAGTCGCDHACGWHVWLWLLLLWLWLWL